MEVVHIKRSHALFAQIEGLMAPLHREDLVLDYVSVCPWDGSVYAYFWHDPYSFTVGTSPAGESARAAIVGLVQA